MHAWCMHPGTLGSHDFAVAAGLRLLLIHSTLYGGPLPRPATMLTSSVTASPACSAAAD